jgi:hypothetical protein
MTCLSLMRKANCFGGSCSGELAPNMVDMMTMNGNIVLMGQIIVRLQNFACGSVHVPATTASPRLLRVV